MKSNSNNLYHLGNVLDTLDGKLENKFPILNHYSFSLMSMTLSRNIIIPCGIILFKYRQTDDDDDDISIDRLIDR